jgi:hypothetical protein
LTSEQLISSTSDELLVNADDSLQILSDAGSIELISGTDASLSGTNYLRLLARFGVHVCFL